jgi:DNA-binding MarR family transcriptional regulator
MIDRMEESGLLERRRDPTDRRAWRIHLTELARERVGEVRQCLAPLRDMLLEGLDTAERAALTRGLEIMRANLAANRDLGIATNG